MHLLALHAMRTLLMLLVVRSAAGSELPALKMSTFDAQIVDILWLGPDRKKVLLNTKRGCGGVIERLSHVTSQLLPCSELQRAARRVCFDYLRLYSTVL